MQPDRLRIVSYRPDHRDRWSAFVRGSKNGVFLFERDFMEYHADRFADASLLVFDGDDEADLVAVLPASRDGGRLASHAGLTYGGWITDARMTTPGMLAIFERLKAWAPGAGITSLVYKAAPRCYHRLPAEEDLYALFVQGAQLVRQDVSSVIELAAAPAWAKGRKHALAKARQQEISAELSADFSDFHACLRDALAAHDVTPTHSLAEIERLAARFPQQIRLYAAQRRGQAVAYALVFDNGQTVHTQYLCARDEGRRSGGLEAIIHRLQQQDFADRRYLSFGISTEQGGRVLNPGLIAQKEMFGGRAMVCPTFELAFPG